MNAPEVLTEYARLSEPGLRAFLDRKAAALRDLPVPFPADVLKEYVLRGGKRLRGALVLLGCEAGGGDPMAALDASLGAELLHAYLLIHDDFMDRDDVRRGGPTVHVALGGGHQADSVAVLLGSLCQAWAYELILAAPRGLEAARVLTTALQDVTVGQALDLLATRAPALDAAGVLRVETLKTGSYSFELPLRLGGTIGGAKPPTLDALSRYALPLGQAFQIADDLLGTFGAPEVTGKSAASDLREGKRTLLVARALEMATPADAARLREGLGHAEAVDELREILRRSGAETAAREEAQRLCNKAIAALEGLPPGVASDLREIALYSVHRAL